MIAIAEVKRALLIIDHHLRWVERDLDLKTATEINHLIKSTSEQAEGVFKKCRITMCKTCDEILKLRPEMDRQTVHDWHKKERVKYEYQNL